MHLSYPSMQIAIAIASPVLEAYRKIPRVYARVASHSETVESAWVKFSGLKSTMTESIALNLAATNLTAIRFPRHLLVVPVRWKLRHLGSPNQAAIRQAYFALEEPFPPLEGWTVTQLVL